MTDKEKEAKLKKLHAIRGGNRSAITRLEKQAKAIVEEVQNSGSSVDILVRLETLSAALVGKHANTKGLDEEIIELCAVEEIKREIEETTEWELRITEILGKIKAVQTGRYSQPSAHGTGGQGSSTPTPSRPASPSQNTRGAEILFQAPGAANSLNISGGSTTNSNVGGIRLPKINLPKFNGDVTRFMSFWQSFNCAIHSNDSLSAVNKMNYLVNLLEGPAYSKSVDWS